ncbi:DUF3576 domain-containing protein [Cypionkella sp.]|uniref:DUF3576 domain-containing protein n=1 Tax=Cypionkella sp. TaxID=2811411 RepID=UPI002ABBB134|nr:DUF3576 domain-containing protein [Cypionkella sp.]MDZ4394819.1 DUF3576 domain-containing protein [Cypionkella sp.]
MILRRIMGKALNFGLMAALLTGISACGGSGMFGGRPIDPDTQAQLSRENREDARNRTSGIGQLFRKSDNPNTTVEVNKYLWKASLDVLNFLPIESVDPFTGVIVTGYGTPPGGGRAVRATIYVQDPALDARSLKIAMQGSGGGSVSPETIRAVEDAILTRARQLRIQDSKL